MNKRPQERTMQHVFNVLMFNKVLAFDAHVSDNPNQPAQNPTYTVEGTDPFYMTDEEFERLEKNYNENNRIHN